MWPGAAALAGAGLMVLTPPFFYSCPSAPGHSGQVAEPEFEPRVYAERARCERSEPGLFDKESSILGEHQHLGEGRQPQHRGVSRRMCGRIPGLYPLEASSTPSLPSVPRGPCPGDRARSHTWLRIIVLESLTFKFL